MHSRDVVVTAPPGRCLNCEADLHGPFCSHCGQRAMPPYPSLTTLTADSWHELSGWDGRYARTIAKLFRRPGELTREVLEGHWARYVSPLRLYFLASVMFFLIGALVPSVVRPQPAEIPGRDGNITIDLMDPRGATALSADERDRALRSVERAPVVIRGILRFALIDPAGLRQRVVDNVPRVMFVLVPVYAGIVAMFYRRRPFSQHIVFALHLHTLVFLALGLARLSHVMRSPTVAGAMGATMFLYIISYALIAFRRVYRESWPRIVAKSAGIAVIYTICGVFALLGVFAWVATFAPAA